MSDRKIEPGSWGEGYRAGYAQALEDARLRLLEVAEWCGRNGFASRARITQSAAARVGDMADNEEQPNRTGGSGV